MATRGPTTNADDDFFDGVPPEQRPPVAEQGRPVHPMDTTPGTSKPSPIPTQPATPTLTPTPARATAVSPALQVYTNIKRELLRTEGLRDIIPDRAQADRLISLVLTSLWRNKSLLQCTPASVVLACKDALSLGLEVETPLDEAWLIPYKGEVQLSIGVRGLLRLLRESPVVSHAYAHVVHERDEWQVILGDDRKIIHIPSLEDRGRLRAAYAVIVYKSGQKDFEYMLADEIEQAHQQSKQPDGLMWRLFPQEAWKKTVLRRLMKRAPLSVRMAKALVVEEGKALEEVEVPNDAE